MGKPRFVSSSGQEDVGCPPWNPVPTGRRAPTLSGPSPGEVSPRPRPHYWRCRRSRLLWHSVRTGLRSEAGVLRNTFPGDLRDTTTILTLRPPTHRTGFSAPPRPTPGLTVGVGKVESRGRYPSLERRRKCQTLPCSVDCKFRVTSDVTLGQRVGRLSPLPKTCHDHTSTVGRDVQVRSQARGSRTNRSPEAPPSAETWWCLSPEGRDPVTRNRPLRPPPTTSYRGTRDRDWTTTSRR